MVSFILSAIIIPGFKIERKKMLFNSLFIEGWLAVC